MPKTPKNTSWDTRYSLLNRVRDPKDQESWKEFMSYYEHYIYYILRRFKVPPSDTEELCQDIMVKLWKALPGFAYDKNRGKFRQWLSTVIRSEIRKYVRKNERRKELLENNNEYILNQLYDSDPESENTEIDKVIDEEWKHYIMEIAWEHIAHCFNETAQNVFLMSIEGCPPEEIAERCGIKKDSIRVYKQRIKDSLRDEMERLDEQFF